ncbi:DUF1805 domain-containing protein [Pradoshia sp. D12]|jgi:uncharacterized protein YunC (DUF1805 family)|uniref:YunC family protein n=1 Tax=Bacillaceae TaxID=186817 RepID=UPI00080AEF7E|nr:MULTISPECIES: DUF1805 domain-containing protein [Bacillaceae]OCA84834.1 hypothetical protein A8L44_10675 [Bacillus sp. FJAT-27986]QFK72699.1 DUF1805 domain-containing protein [Pradoshia sp. D12]TPF71693.1 DUF1805 domain-containing protein [Bacillus sp. D12]
MIEFVPFEIDGKLYKGVSVQLPKTSLLAIAGQKGYIMCGALDIGLLNERLNERRIIAGRAVGVRTLEELLNAPLESVTEEAKRRGIVPGMLGKDAIQFM